MKMKRIEVESLRDSIASTYDLNLNDCRCSDEENLMRQLERGEITPDEFEKGLVKIYDELNKICLSRKEKDALLKAIQDNLKMFIDLDNYFKESCTLHLRQVYECIQEKIKSEVNYITDFEKSELIHLLTSLEMFAGGKIKDLKSKGIDPQQDEELLFLNSLYKKLHHYFLNYDKYQ